MLAHETVIAEGDSYPEGESGDLAVGYYTRAGGSWRLIPVESRAEAEEKFRAVIGQPDVLRVVLADGPHAGRSSAVTWIARCNGGEDWSILEETEGMRTHRPRD